MSRTRSLPLLVISGGVTGLVLTATALALGAAHGPTRPQTGPVPPSLAAQAVSSPSPLTPRVAPRRASRGGVRSMLLPVRFVSRTVAVGSTFSGLASWYGGSFQGQRTANGERFDTHALTAASRTLPFGTRLRVCLGPRCVVVRVNDRGPYAGDRVLDLTQAARDRLGSFGVAQVTATPVSTRWVALRTAPAVAAPVVRLATAAALVVPGGAVPTTLSPRLAASPQGASGSQSLLAADALLTLVGSSNRFHGFRS